MWADVYTNGAAGLGLATGDVSAASHATAVLLASLLVVRKDTFLHTYRYGSQHARSSSKPLLLL
jgi:hypothetical protein